MSAASKARSDSDKGEQRRQQVLDAATECFRREGFHGSSIARISQAAGMSPGHIYHYFANKEAIVEAIAEREQDEMGELVRRLEQDQDGGDVIARLTRHSAETVARNSDPAHVGLMLELAAESARNPAIAAILNRTDHAIASNFLDLVRRVGAPPGLDEDELRLRMEMIATLFKGLALRSLIQGQRDQSAIVRLLNQHIRLLLETPA